MTTRRLIPLAIISTLFLCSGCAGPEEVTKTDGQAQATEPRASGDNTKADLLVGKWKLVERDITALPDPGYKSTREFTRDGQFTKWTDNPATRPGDPGGNPRVQTGVYRVEGNKLILTFVGPVATVERTLIIDTLTPDKLITSCYDPADPGWPPIVAEYERILLKL
jgi:hypothetical protein